VSYRVLYADSYNRRAASFVRRHLQLLTQYEKTLQLLEINPFHPSLRLHRLKGPLKDLHSVSINISYRITLEFLIDEKTIIPVNVGKHVEVY
jgi:proteic killer suppression protein